MEKGVFEGSTYVAVGLDAVQICQTSEGWSVITYSNDGFGLLTERFAAGVEAVEAFHRTVNLLREAHG